jgi:hypothetical protein
MSNSLQTVDEPLSPTQALQMNAICDRFEAVWKATPPGVAGPHIEKFLGDGVGPEFAQLLRHLVLLDIDYRKKPWANPSRTAPTNPYLHRLAAKTKECRPP